MSARERSADGLTSQAGHLSPQGGPVVIDSFAEQGPDPLINSYEESIRAELAEGEDLATRLRRAPAAVRSAYQHRQELLDALPIGDVSGKVCVDFGVGRHGFAARFPKLQQCTRAIGVDLSYAAIKASADVSEGGRYPYSRNYAYFTSRGDHIDLDDASADLVYAGESIERVESAEAFLEEVHRILKPGGLLVLTTIMASPDAPCLSLGPVVAAKERRGLMARLSRVPRKAFSRLGQFVRANPSLRKLARFVKRRLGRSAAPALADLGAVQALAAASGLDHLGPLDYAELRRCLAGRFDLVEVHGYGGTVDGTVHPIATGDGAATTFAPPERARGIVLLARRSDDYQSAGCRQQRYRHDAAEIVYRGGPWEVTALYRALTGRRATGGEGAWLLLPFTGEALTLHFWAHSWGGEAVIEVDGIRRSVNLYSPNPHMKRVPLHGLPPGKHELRISGSPNRDARSGGNQVIFYQATVSVKEETPASHSGCAVPKRTAAEREQLRKKVAARQWFHTIDLGDGIVTPGCDHSPTKIGYLKLPERLDGRSVLDIGAYDGFFSFECERRGASRVVAADHYCWSYGGMATKDGFDIARMALGSRVEEAFIPVEEISPQRLGVFDLVLFLGVLYHAPDPLRYLRIVRAVCRGQVILETEIDAEDYPQPAAVFYPGATLNNDASNFWGPNMACVEALLHEAGFRRVERICTFNMVRRGTRPFHRAVFHAFV
ncbi:MAG TPA: class I SAM-dependent methyltransferase [Gemmataceae bacterium]|nr:class I SAM-dependent methyltransferase [Gemmataceae bacterium]